MKIATPALTSIPWKRWGVRLAVGLVIGLPILAYGQLRLQIARQEREIREGQAKLDGMRPALAEVVKAQEMEAALQAHRQFAEVLRSAVIDWEAVFQQVAATIPPSVLLHTITTQDAAMTVRGVLRYPPRDAQAYLVGVAAALKKRRVFTEIVVTVSPPDPDDPSVARVELTGRLR